MRFRRTSTVIQHYDSAVPVSDQLFYACGEYVRGVDGEGARYRRRTALEIDLEQARTRVRRYGQALHNVETRPFGVSLETSQAMRDWLCTRINAATDRCAELKSHLKFLHAGEWFHWPGEPPDAVAFVDDAHLVRAFSIDSTSSDETRCE